jgi:hypothetical protein
MNDCPSWGGDHPTAAYLGSASQGLGFYHLEVPSSEETKWLNMSNCGLVRIKAGSITQEELKTELANIYCKEWPWQIREMEAGRYLVRFPPHKKVADIKNYPSFNLRKEGVQVEVLEWSGEVQPYSVLQDVWIQMTGIPPKFFHWKIFAQIASSFGLLMEVDWPSVFKSFYEMVRIRISCKDAMKIPTNRLFEMGREIFVVSFLVEGKENVNGKDSSDNGNDGGDNDDMDNDEEADDLDDETDGVEKPLTSEFQVGSSSGSKTPSNKVSNSNGHKTVANLEEVDQANLLMFMMKAQDDKLLTAIAKQSQPEVSGTSSNTDGKDLLKTKFDAGQLDTSWNMELPPVPTPVMKEVNTGRLELALEKNIITYDGIDNARNPVGISKTAVIIHKENENYSNMEEDKGKDQSAVLEGFHTPENTAYMDSDCKMVGNKFLSLISDESHHSKWEEFRRLAREGVPEECSKLLERMELEDDEDEDDLLEEAEAGDGKTEEYMSLTELGIVEDRAELIAENVEKMIDKNLQKRKQKWGPVERMARPRRGKEDGKTVLMKAQDLAKIRNLEKGKPPKSFASESNSSLLLKAQCVNINLGNNATESYRIIEKLKEIEKKCGDNFLKANPEISLPDSVEVENAMLESPPLSNVRQPHLKKDGSLIDQSWAEIVSEGNAQNSEPSINNDRSLLEH